MTITLVMNKDRSIQAGQIEDVLEGLQKIGVKWTSGDRVTTEDVIPGHLNYLVYQEDGFCVRGEAPKNTIIHANRNSFLTNIRNIVKNPIPKFKEGDHVIVAAKGYVYKLYHEWATKHNLENWKEGRKPERYCFAYVTCSHKHHIDNIILYGVRQNGFDYIMGEEGLKKADDTSDSLPIVPKEKPSRKATCHSMVFEFPNGDIVNVPGPKGTEGIIDVKQLNHKDCTDSYVLLDSTMYGNGSNSAVLSDKTVLKFLNIPARQIIKEYEKRISHETPRVLSFTKWEITVLPEQNCEEDSYKVSYPTLREFLG